MTADDFTTAARAEAERRWPRLPHDPSGHYLNMGKRVGFDLGAQWAAAQEPTDAEVLAVRALHRPAQVYTLTEDCTDPDTHEWGTASHGGDDLCLSEPTGEQFCTECCPGDAFDCTDYPYPCATIQALDSVRAARDVRGQG